MILSDPINSMLSSFHKQICT